MTINEQNVRSLRVGVEPVEMEVDGDEGILWTSLQTAFPGCSGMYYREHGDPCKRSVRFDGKKFLPPAGVWSNKRDYYVTLSQRCPHQNGNPTSTYTEATKQFEKSVQAVQRMMVASGMRIDVGHLAKRRPHRDTNSSTDSSTDRSDPLAAIQQRSNLLKSVENRELTPLEQQFLDLCRISTGKDQIIEANRHEMVRLNDRIANLQNEVKDAEMRLSEASAKIGGQEQELEILRNLGAQFGESKESVEELTQKSSNLEENLADFQLKLMNLEEENQTLKAQIEENSKRFIEMDKSIRMLETSKNLLSKELDQLRPFAQAAELDDYQNLPTYLQTMKWNQELQEELKSKQELVDQYDNIHTPMLTENVNLRKKTEDLERRLAHVDEEIKCLNENWAKELKGKQVDWAKIKDDSEQEISSLRHQLAHLQTILESATRDAAENARRVCELEQERNEIRRMSDAMHAKTQDELRYQNRVLRDELSEAESRVAELNVLVSTLAAEASNSRRDINDIL